MALLKKVESAEPADERDSLGAQDLRDPNPEIRRRAAQTMRDVDHVAALIAVIEQEENRAVRAAIFNALREIGGEQVAMGLVQFLGCEDTEIRNASVAAMKTLGTYVGQIMPDLLLHEDPDVRIMAIDILQDLDHPSAPAWLGDVLLQDENQNVIGTAIDRLVEIGTAEQCDALHAAAKRFPNDPFIAFAAEQAILAIDDGQEK